MKLTGVFLVSLLQGSPTTSSSSRQGSSPTTDSSTATLTQSRPPIKTNTSFTETNTTSNTATFTSRTATTATPGPTSRFRLGFEDAGAPPSEARSRRPLGMPVRMTKEQQQATREQVEREDRERIAREAEEAERGTSHSTGSSTIASPGELTPTALTSFVYSTCRGVSLFAGIRGLFVSPARDERVRVQPRRLALAHQPTRRSVGRNRPGRLLLISSPATCNLASSVVLVLVIFTAQRLGQTSDVDCRRVRGRLRVCIVFSADGVSSATGHPTRTETVTLGKSPPSVGEIGRAHV